MDKLAIDSTDINIIGIARIIARRDGTTVEEEANNIADTLMLIRKDLAEGIPSDPEDTWADGTGLEPDYLLEVLHLI